MSKVIASIEVLGYLLLGVLCGFFLQLHFSLPLTLVFCIVWYELRRSLKQTGNQIFVRFEIGVGFFTIGLAIGIATKIWDMVIQKL